MPNYTLCLLLRTSLSEEERKKTLQDLEKSLNSENNLQVTQWGKKDLAYPIQKETQAYYYLVDFEGEATTPSNLDKKFKLEEKVLRFLVVRRKLKKIPKETKETKETKGAKTKKATKTKEPKERTIKAKKQGGKKK